MTHSEKARLSDQPAPADTLCACGCGYWTHSLTPGGMGKVYITGHNVAERKSTDEWYPLEVGETIQIGDRVGGENGSLILRGAVGVGTQVSEFSPSPIYRKRCKH